METSKQAEIDPQDIKQRSFKGVIALTSRTFVLQVIALVATFILTVLLDPATFGIFFVVTAIVNFLNYFSDIGLAAALIQKSEEPTDEDLATTFTIQQIMVAFVVTVALFLSQFVAKFYHFDAGGLFLLRALIISFFLSSLKTIPSVLLERKLHFTKLVIPQIVESITFYSVAIILAYYKIGVVSFAWAAILRGITGTVTLYLIAPWKPQLQIKPASAKKLLSFGLPYQANSFLALLKDDLLTVFLGKILPFSAIGYIGWAKKWAEIALRLIMDNIIKVTFPAYSRLQVKPELLTKAIHKSLVFLSLLSFPIAVGMMFMIHPIIEVIPRYIKWEPAILSFYLFTISSILATLSSPLINALNALGKVKYTFIMMLIWTVLTWALVPFMVFKFGFNGVAMASVIIGLTSFMPLMFIRKIIPIIFISQIIKPLMATIGMVVVLFLVRMITKSSLERIILGSLMGFATYIFLIYLMMEQEIKPYILLLFHPKIENKI